jgi:hypothetical protein
VYSINLKCNSWVTIFGNGICMDPRRVQTIIDWTTLIYIWDVQCFIAHYSTIVDPLIRWIQKDQLFSWGVEVKNAFQFFRVFFTTTPLLIHVDLVKPFV